MNITDTRTSLHPIVMPASYNFQTLNCYLLQEEGTVTLIDAGFQSEECWETFTSACAANGLRPDEIDRIILTHSHPDHIGLADRIAKLRGIPIYAHREASYRLRRDPDYLMMRIEFFRELYQSLGCGDDGDRQVEKMKLALASKETQPITGDIVPLDDGDFVAGLKVIATTGHAPDHIALLHGGQGWLFAGDLLISHMTSTALVEPDLDGRRTLSLIQYIASLKKCLELDVRIAYSGHGVPISDFRSLCLTRLQGIQRRADKILRCIASGITVPKHIALAYYKELYCSNFSFVISETIAYLDYLELENKVGKRQIDGVWHYSL